MTTTSPRTILSRVRRVLSHRARLIAARLGVPSDRDLVISFLFPPSSETAGIVMAKRLRTWPRDVDVIANQPPGNRAEDPGTLKIAGRRLKRIARVKGRKNALKNWSIVEKFCINGDAEIRRFERTRGPYRRVHSRAMMPASHFLAMQYKLRRPSVRWTAEFSDPMMYDTHGQRRRTPTNGAPLAKKIARAIADHGLTLGEPDDMFELVEYGAYVLADEIHFTNDVQRDFMISKITDLRLQEEVRAKAVVAPHPSPAPELYDSALASSASEPDRFEVAYFGAFYTLRGVADILAPFARLTAAERCTVRLRVYTDKVQAAEPAVAEHGVEDCVEVHGYVPFLDFLALAKRVDLLLLADARVAANHAVNPYLPSKVSDYRGAGTPIWALVEPGSPLSQLGDVTTTPLGDVDAQVAQLRDFIATRVRRDSAPRSTRPLR